jgi:nucleoid-associated protein YejK
MVKINNIILHILDFNSGITVFSDQEISIENSNINTYLEKHLEKSYNDLNLKIGVFKNESKFKINLSNYISGNSGFVEFSRYVAQLYHTFVSKSDKLDSQDLITCDFMNETGDRIIGFLLCTNKIGYTHRIVQNNGITRNDIINHHAILPSSSQKIDEFAFINTSSLEIKYFEKKRFIDGRDAFILSDIIFECNSIISTREAVKLVNTITRNIAESHGDNSIIAVSKAKNYLIENIELSDKIEPANLGREVFEDSPIKQEEFIKEIQNAGIPQKISISKSYALKAGKNHKIKTDTGIEISFPVEYFENKDYIEFINNIDGTISIQLNNIGSIINK